MEKSITDTAISEHLKQVKAETEFKNSGGKWLGAARSWIQWNCPFGDMVRWGSNDVLKRDFTVKDIEDIAKIVAYEALKEKGYFK